MQLRKLFRGISSQSRHEEDDADLKRTNETSLDDIIERWRSVLQVNPSDKNARRQLLEVYARTRQWEDARGIADGLDSEFSDDYQIRLTIAKAFQKKNNAAQEMELWQKMHEDFPEALEPMVVLSKIYMNENQLEKASVLSEKALVRYPGNMRALLTQGQILHRKNKSAQAIKAFLSILENEPDHYETEVSLASALLKEQRFDELLERLEIAKVVHPEQSSLQIFEFRAHARLGNHEKALIIIDRLIDQERNRLKAEYFIEKLDLLLKLGKVEEVEKQCEHAIDLFPKNIRLLTLYARVAQRKLNTA